MAILWFLVQKNNHTVLYLKSVGTKGTHSPKRAMETAASVVAMRVAGKQWQQGQ
jgi:hypothetical protein